jgi:phage-related protein
MKLLLVVRGEYDIYAACSPRGECWLLDFLSNLQGVRQKQADHLLQLLARMAQNGPPRRAEICHQIQGPIWQLTAGTLRVFWFYGAARKLIICTHGYAKSTAKTPTQQIKRALAVFETYQQAAAAGTVEYLEDDDETEK